MEHEAHWEVLRERTALHPSAVWRSGDVIIRAAGPWTPAVHALLRHLEQVGFDGAPQLVGSGFDEKGRETLTYIDGEFTQPGPWTESGAGAVGALLRSLHTATASFRPPEAASWYRWFGRSLGDEPRIIGHCDVAPWNIVARDGRPIALIDWDFAGPVDALVELAQACWLNAKLYSDDVAELEGLPPLDERARQVRAILDGYGLASKDRAGFVDRIVEFVVHATANEADELRVTPDTAEPGLTWALAWRARSAAWISRHRSVLQNALV